MSSPNPESSGPPLRALAMVLISLAILFAAIGALSLTGSDGSEEAAAPDATSEVAQAPATSQAAQAPPASTSATSSAPTTSADPSDVEVRVLNNSDVSGLAASTAATLTAEGWTITETGNYAESQVASTTVYYGTAAGADDAAQEIAQQLGARAAALPATITGFGNGVIVMVTQ
ncbi:LytR C-terminal domain-containing protein [Rhodococcus sovatensis]|uniref:LytR C-terminal domain-containing protein n=1 Tax=Rhodococcus sovatensis TaxID=1805840 RepID=A0ABZ2PL91_9NOCA